MALALLSRDQRRPRYYVQTGSMYENPWGVPHGEISEMEATLPAEKVAQAIYGMYVEGSGLLFSAEILGKLFDGEELRVEEWTAEGYDIPSLLTTTRTWEDLLRRAWPKFAMGVDLARTNDYTVIMVFDVTACPARPGHLVYYRRLNRVSWDTIYSAIARTAAAFRVEALLDSTGMGGDVVTDELDSRFYCPQCDLAVPYTLSNGREVCPKCNEVGKRFEVAGYNFSGKRKEQLITRLQTALSYGQKLRPDWGLLRMPHIEQVMDELTFYRMPDNGLETDAVMALGLVAAQMEFDEVGGIAASVHG